MSFEGDGGAAVVSGWCCEKKDAMGSKPCSIKTCRGSTRRPWLRCAAGSTVVMTPRRSGIWQHDRPPILFRPVLTCLSVCSPRPILCVPILSPNTRSNRRSSVPGPLLLPSAICRLSGSVPTSSRGWRLGPRSRKGSF